jgi:curli biogenesis system outer membrane secretion channel CsgG
MNARYAMVCAALCLSLFCCTTPGRTARPGSTPFNGTVAVWEIENMSILGGTQMEISDFITSRVLDTIRTEGNVVVEREKLLSVLAELSLGASELADPDTQLRVGRLVGAQRMVFGGYQVLGQSMRIDLRLVEVETGRVLKAAQKTVESGDVTLWLTAAEEAAKYLVLEE